MNVLLLHRDLLFRGGVCRCFLCYAQNRDRRRVRLQVGSLERPEVEMVEALRRQDVIVHDFAGNGFFASIRKLRNAIGETRVQILAATSFRAYLIAKAATAGSHCRVVFWIHSIPLVIRGKVRRWLFQLLARHDPLIFVSNAVRAAHCFPAHRAGEYVVYDGVGDPFEAEAVSPYPRAFRRQLGLADDALVIGCIAEFIGWKNHSVLLPAFANLVRRRPEACLLLIGVGELLEATRRLAERLQVSDRVMFLGSRTDARRLLGIMDIYAHPANGEGFGLAVVEAMLAGLPVVAADSGAVIEFIDHGQNGLLARADDATSFETQLEKLAADPALRKRLGAQARPSCLRRFHPAEYAARLTEVFDAELAAPRT